MFRGVDKKEEEEGARSHCATRPLVRERDVGLVPTAVRKREACMPNSKILFLECPLETYVLQVHRHSLGYILSRTLHPVYDHTSQRVLFHNRYAKQV